MLTAIIIASPIIRAIYAGRLSPTHTLLHLDGLAIGALVALSLRSYNLSRLAWRRIANAALTCGVVGAVAMVFRGSGLTDSLLAVGFGGMLISGLLANSAPNAYNGFLTARPLKFLGTISYGLYMIHILVFVTIGDFDLKMTPYGALGDFAVVGVRLALSIGAASLMWYGFERPILTLKHYFIRKESARAEESTTPQMVPAELQVVAE